MQSSFNEGVMNLIREGYDHFLRGFFCCCFFFFWQTGEEVGVCLNTVKGFVRPSKSVHYSMSTIPFGSASCTSPRIHSTFNSF